MVMIPLPLAGVEIPERPIKIGRSALLTIPLHPSWFPIPLVHRRRRWPLGHLLSGFAGVCGAEYCTGWSHAGQFADDEQCRRAWHMENRPATLVAPTGHRQLDGDHHWQQSQSRSFTGSSGRGHSRARHGRFGSRVSPLLARLEWQHVCAMVIWHLQ